MPEATPRTRRTAKTEAEAPQAASTADAVADTPPVSPARVVVTDEDIALRLRTFIEYRRAQVRAPRLGGNPGGAAMIAGANALGWLNELEHFAEWLEQGSPTDAAVLTEEDKKFWLRAKDAGLTVPVHILRQLGG